MTPERFDEQYHTVRGEMRYQALYASDMGVLRTLITRAEENKHGGDYFKAFLASRGRGSQRCDYRAEVDLFALFRGVDAWTRITELLYGESEGRDVPMHGALSDDHLDKLREDSDRLVGLAAAILASHTTRSPFVGEEVAS